MTRTRNVPDVQVYLRVLMYFLYFKTPYNLKLPLIYYVVSRKKYLDQNTNSQYSNKNTLRKQTNQQKTEDILDTKGTFSTHATHIMTIHIGHCCYLKVSRDLNFQQWVLYREISRRHSTWILCKFNP